MMRWLKWKREHRERGATLVEFAVIAPVLILLVFGGIEFGLAFKDRHAISGAANSAARSGATAGTDPAADIAILAAVEAGLGGLADPAKINHVDIFKADNAGNKGVFNRYVYVGGGAGVCHWSPCPDPSVTPVVYGSPSQWGDPCNRNTILDTTNPINSLDTLGIEIEYNHQWITGILGTGPQVWTETALVRLEPDLLGDASAGPSCP